MKGNTMLCRVVLVVCLGWAVVACSTSPATNSDTAPVPTSSTMDAVGLETAPATPETMTPTPQDAAGPAADIVGYSDAASDTMTDLPATPGLDGALPTAKAFSCSWVLGITTTGEWYRAGF